MNHDDLIQRISRARMRKVPEPRALLERAYPASGSPGIRALPVPLAHAATAALVAASASPLWLPPADIDRERIDTLVQATALTTQLYVQQWNEVMHTDD